MTASITTAEEKARLRTAIRAQLAAMPESIRRAEDDALFSAFLSLPEVERADTIFLFCQMLPMVEGRILPFSYMCGSGAKNHFFD